MPTRARTAGALALLAVLLLAAQGEAQPQAAPRGGNVFAQFDLPDPWEARFWADPSVKALLALDAKGLASLVPIQAGIRYCRCPDCDATEAENPLTWSAAKPNVLTCRRCGATALGETTAKDKDKEKDKKTTEEVVEVLPHVLHHYPYVEVAAHKQRYPDERLFLAAKRDYEAREFLARAALYAAVRHHEQPAGSKDATLARLAAILVLRFAQVYPAYATHFDQPDSPKLFQQADLPPPYRRGYRTGKWDWTASLDVPLNLVIAYALIRDDPALVEAGRCLGDAHPSRTIERDLFRASAEFVRLQPEEYSEMSLQAYRGLLAVGRLLDDPGLVREALVRLEGFAQRGFYYDGSWRQGDANAHKRILAIIDGWIERLLAGYPNAALPAVPGSAGVVETSTAAEVPMLALARRADAAVLSDRASPEIQQAAWPPINPRTATKGPALLGGLGLARLSVGQGDSALDLEVRGQDSRGAPHFQRQAMRLAVAGRLVLGDLDGLIPTETGWDRATVSHNTVVVDGLNQREALSRASEPADGGDFVFFAADPDFQVVTLDDPRAYPQSTSRYRQTLVATEGPAGRYAVGVFEVEGGLQHDQVFHAAHGLRAAWELSVGTTDGPRSLLPPSIPFVPTARAEDGRWFVQAYGELAPGRQAHIERPAMAWLAGPDKRGVRLHVLGDMPLSAITATGPDPAPADQTPAAEEPGRSALVLRRRSSNGATLKTTFVTVFEPLGNTAGLTRVGRVASTAETVVVYVESSGGAEHVIVNLKPGTAQSVVLAGGQHLSTDGVAVRVSRTDLVLAGGTFARREEQRVEQPRASGTIVAAIRQVSSGSRGWFESTTPVPVPASLAGRTLFIHHGDGPTRGWTLERVENTRQGARLYVVEEPGFTLATPTGSDALYYQFPGISVPGPHHFGIARIARTSPLAARP